MTKESMTKKERRKLKKQQKKLYKQTEEHKKKRTKLLTYIVIGITVVVVGFIINNQIVPVPEDQKNKPVDQVLESDWYKGSLEAQIVLMEYSDYQCPACAGYVEMLDELANTFGNDVAIVFRHFPLKQIHPKSELAAQAAEAAGRQGKFWEMSDVLFARQEEWSQTARAKSVMVGYAEELGLDVKQFRKDMSSKEVRGKVKADYLSAMSLRLNSTPTFFINGEKISNPTSVQSFEELIEAELLSTSSAELE